MHIAILFVVAFTLVGGLALGSNLLVLSVASHWLLLAITIIIAYLITSDGCAPW